MNYDVYDLIAHLAEQKEPGLHDLEDEEDLSDFIYYEYGIDIEAFVCLVNDLLPLCSIAQSPLTGTWYRGFGTDNIWLFNKKVE
jgi:hypothetical protein